jgi:acyl-CoA synthetase (AMP-forming)/AMP-acid ligase II
MQTATGRDARYYLHESIRRTAARQPGTVAVAHAGAALTFAELDELSNRLAQHLRRSGVAAGARVAVCLPPGPGSLVAQVAVIKLAAVAVVLDPDRPQAWLEFLLDSVEAHTLVTRSPTLGRVALDRDFPVLLLDRDDQWRTAPPTAPNAPVTDDTVCHVTYHGSPGGLPRPVLRTHGQLRHVEQSRCLRMFATGATVTESRPGAPTGPARR